MTSGHGNRRFSRLPLVVTVSSWLAATPALAAASVHKPHLADQLAHGDVAPILERRGFAAGRAEGGAAAFSRVIYGYYPYWASDTATIPWEHLTHLSYFSVVVNSNGTLGTSNGWSTAGAALVTAGHQAGVKVTLTATLFDNAAIGTLLNDASARSALVDNLLALVSAQGGDGVNIDFESVPYSAKQSFVTFMGALTAAFHAAIPGSHVSLASPAVDWSGSYDYDMLAQACDGLLIMGYGYHWGGGSPGPVAPIEAGMWNSRDLRWTVDDYLAYGGVENRDRFILGFPLYGYDWPAASSTVPGTSTGSATPKVMRSCESSFASQGKQYDATAQTPYLVYNSGSWHQLFCEDEASIAAKLDLVMDPAVDFGGAMFWALSYVDADHPIWAQVDARFARPPLNQPPVAVAQAPGQAQLGEEIQLDGTQSYDPDGDLLAYAWSAVQGPAVALSGMDRSRASVVLQAPGAYRFRLVVSDGVATATDEVEIEVFEIDDDGGGPGDAGPGDAGPGDDGPGDDGPGDDGPGDDGPGEADLEDGCGGCAAADSAWVLPALLPAVAARRRRERR